LRELTNTLFLLTFFLIYFLTVNGIEFVGANIRWLDAKTGTRSEVSDLSLETGAIRFDEPVAVSSMFSKDPATILTALNLPPDVDGKRLIADILSEEKISIAGGQLKLQGKIIRIAHMGYISKKDLDAGFAALSKRLSPARA